MIVVGDSLRSINGQQVQQQLRTRAGQYPPVAADLVNAGWMAEWPVPDAARFAELTREFGTQAEAGQEPVRAPIEAEDSGASAGEQRSSRLAEKIRALLEKHGHSVNPRAPIDSIIGILDGLLANPPSLAVRRKIGEDSEGEEPLPRSPDVFRKGADDSDAEEVLGGSPGGLRKVTDESDDEDLFGDSPSPVRKGAAGGSDLESTPGLQKVRSSAEESDSEEDELEGPIVSRVLFSGSDEDLSRSSNQPDSPSPKRPQNDDSFRMSEADSDSLQTSPDPIRKADAALEEEDEEDEEEERHA
jgi:hypothetical protein